MTVPALIGITLGLSSLSAADFFPIEFGNSWTYRNHASGQQFTIRVGTPSVVNDRVYYSLRGYVDSNLLVRTDERNNLVYLDNETNEERVLISFVPFEGGWWHAPFRPCEQESQTQEKRTTLEGAAGTFRDVLNIRFRGFSCADAGTDLEQFAENIGMVRRVENTIAGPKQFDLVHARIGTMTIDALPTGRFSLTLDAPQGSDVLTAVLRVQNNSSEVKLLFPSSQEFEVVLSDEDGNVVWKWSDGKFFEQTTHDRSVWGEWTIAVPFPRPSPGAESATKGYLLSAWLTTAGDAPRFAATVPLTIITPAAQ